MEIDFYGDITCPWSHLGWRRLHAALRLRHLSPSCIHWRPYQLNPDMPQNGMDRGEYLLRKFGHAGRVRDVLATVEAAMRAEGLHVNLSRIRLMPNTARAHRLMGWAEDTGLTDRLLQELFVAYFVTGQDIGDTGVLQDVARLAGLSPDKTGKALNGSDLPPHATQNPLTAPHLLIRAVPYILFNGRYSIAGAHETIAFLPLIDLCRNDPSTSPALFALHNG